MNSRFLFIVAVIFIATSFILQMITLLSNFNGLQSVYLAKIQLVQSQSTSSNIFTNIWNAAKSSTLLGDVIPSYFTLGLFVLCEGTSINQTICSPPSFGYNYNATGILKTINENIPSDAHSTIAKIQQGVFIPSVVLCFILLCYSLFFLCGPRGFCNYLVIQLVSIISLLFCVATFVIQYIAYDQFTAQIDQFKKDLFGGLINYLITVQATRGISLWLSLVAFVLLFLVSIIIFFDCCFGRKQHGS